MNTDDASKIRGAVYVPARAFNAYQMWRDYDRAVVERDLGYAAKLKLNALRVFLSYDYWMEDRARLENSLYHLLHAAQPYKIQVMPVLFDCVGVEPTEESKADVSLSTASCLRSPHSNVINDHTTWFGIEDYVNWFIQRWSHEPRVLALEIINEPRTVAEFKFARSMFNVAAKRRRSIPLTFGAAKLEDHRLMQDLGLEILQVHESFEGAECDVRRRLRAAAETQEILNKPVLVTEWQAPYAAGVRMLNEFRLGHFFWSLMIKPAWLPQQRNDGALPGVFHEKGAVWNLADAQALARDVDFTAEEKPLRPEWAIG